MQRTEGPKSKRPKFITKGKVTFILEKKVIKQKTFLLRRAQYPQKGAPLFKNLSKQQTPDIPKLSPIEKELVLNPLPQITKK